MPGEQTMKPCPFCGAGETIIHENRGVWRGVNGYGPPVSVEVRHSCAPVPGQPQRDHVTLTGRDEKSAVAKWNRRTDADLAAAVAAEREACAQAVEGVQGAEYLPAAIRARSTGSPDALADVRRQARREGAEWMREQAACALEADAAHYTEWSAGELADSAAIRTRALLTEADDAAG